jgi:hypothetical protein
MGKKTFVCIKCHNETHHFVQLIYTNLNQPLKNKSNFNSPPHPVKKKTLRVMVRINREEFGMEVTGCRAMSRTVSLQIKKGRQIG